MTTDRDADEAAAPQAGAEGAQGSREPDASGTPDSAATPDTPDSAGSPDTPDTATAATAATADAVAAGEDEPPATADAAATGTGTGTGTGTDDDPAASAAVDGTAAAGAGLSEEQAELAAQRELRRRIEQRKAEKAGPPPAGGKLSGRAADLLAAVRAVESGGTPDPAVLRSAPAVSAPAPARTVPSPAAASAPGASADPAAVASARAVLGEGGAPESLAAAVVGLLGEQAGEELREDPWQLLALPGVRPEQADGFARALLGAEAAPGDERRAVALVAWLLERAAVQGHTALEASTVRAGLAKQGVPDPDEAVRYAVAEGAVLVFREEETDDEYGESAEAESESDDESGAGDDGIAHGEEGAAPSAPVLLGLDRFALAEESLADGLARLVKTAEARSGEAWDEAARAASSPSAGELLRAVAGHGLVLHTGGEAARAEPVAVAAAGRALGLRTALAVHSENGRDRLQTSGPADGPEAAGDPGTAGVVTVAGLLDGSEGPGRDADGLFALDLLVVLDAPQLDVETAAMLVESLADGSRLVLGGDPGVLGSAGAGRVFGDLLAARICPEIASRTPDPGPIGELVSGIGIGELNQVPAPDKEIVIVPVRDAGEAVHRVVQLVAESVPRAFGLAAGQTQVVTVGHGGAAGTRALNEALKQRLAPGPGRFGGFDPGDRVAYVPAPGRTVQGVVLSAEADGLRVRLDGPVGAAAHGTAGTAQGAEAGERTVTVARERVDSELRHGWALTAHQAAGMRWPAAVVVLPGDAAPALTRTWVYTAFGRAERHLSVVHGVDQALPKAVSEGDGPSAVRGTRLRALVEGLLAPEPAPAP